MCSRTKTSEQRRSRAAERLVIRRLRAAGIRGRTEAQLGLRTKTPDFVFDNFFGLRWLDVKHAVGRGDPAMLAERGGRYCEEWGPGAFLFTLGYTEEYAEALRAVGPVWVLDPASGEQLLRQQRPEQDC